MVRRIFGPEQDYNEIREFLELLFPDSPVIEVRILFAKKTMSGYYNDYARLASDIHLLEGKANIYFTLNQVDQALLSRSANRLTEYPKHTTTDTEIGHRNWLLIDLDSVRPSGISATEDEHEIALERAVEIRDSLAGYGFPEPVLADSGNGCHLLYRVDLPNSREITELVKKFLSVLDTVFTNEDVEVDTSVFNPARICRLYGTKSVKGDSTIDRPHRKSSILNFPEDIQSVDEATLRTFIAIDPKVDYNQMEIAQKGFVLEDWLSKFGIEVSSIKDWGDGKLYKLKQCPWREEHTDQSAYVIKFPNGRIVAGCHHNSCGEENWSTLRDKFEPNRRNKAPKIKDDDNGRPNQADVIIELGKDAKYFHDELEEKYAAIPLGNRFEIHKVRSGKFKRWLTKLYFEETGKSPTSESLSQALGVFEMLADFKGKMHTVSRRCAMHEGKIYYDLTNESWEVVEISTDGWRIIKDPPIYFTRTANMLPQVTPVPYENIDIVRKHFRYRLEEDDVLHVVDLVSKFLPDILDCGGKVILGFDTICIEKGERNYAK